MERGPGGEVGRQPTPTLCEAQPLPTQAERGGRAGKKNFPHSAPPGIPGAPAPPGTLSTPHLSCPLPIAAKVRDRTPTKTKAMGRGPGGGAERNRMTTPATLRDRARQTMTEARSLLEEHNAADDLPADVAARVDTLISRGREEWQAYEATLTQRERHAALADLEDAWRAGDRRAADALTDPNAGAPGAAGYNAGSAAYPSAPAGALGAAGYTAGALGAAGYTAGAPGAAGYEVDSTGLYRKAFETYVHHGERAVLALGAAYVKALTEGTDSEGGHLVPIDWQAQILQAAGARAGLRAQVTAIPTSRDAVEWPIIEGADDVHASAVRRTWVDEQPAEGAASTEPTFGAIRIPVHTAMLTTKASRNLVEDSAVPFTQILAGLFADEVRLSDEQAFITGDGVGKPLGLLNTAGIPTVNSGHASQVTADGLLDLFYGLPAQYRDNAVFVMSSATEDAVRKLKDTNNQYLWVGGFAATPETVLGRTVLSSEFMPAIAAAATPIAFGDFSRYIVVDRIGFAVQRIDGDQQLAEKNQIGFVGRQRVGGRVTQPRAFRLQTISV